MSPAEYKSVPTNDDDDQQQVDQRFERPHPSLWKRAALISFLAVLFWLSFYLQPGKKQEPNVVYATRYSKEHQYRPAASPVITEQLKDGRVRLRGAHPTV